MRLRRLLVFVVLLASVAVPRFAEGKQHATRTRAQANGIAILYAKGPFNRDYSAKATMSLPRDVGEQSWYSTWLMLVSNGAKSHREFLQGGLIRWAGHRYALSAFVAFRRPGGHLIFRDLGLLRSGPHRVQIVGDRRLVRFIVDGRAIYRFRRSSIFLPGAAPYLQVGAEVKKPYDRAVGTIWALQLKRDSDRRAAPWTPACERYDRGLHFVRVHGRYIADGYFLPSQPSGFIGCRDFAKKR